MSSLENQEINHLSSYIKTISDQEIKVLILKLKNEMMKDEATWEQIKEILNSIKKKNIKILLDIIPLIIV
ncbi:MAG: hypothetical protein ACRENO_01205 [Thermodesulfobacteriota bacterium]